MSDTSKRNLRKLAAIVREELRYSAAAIDRDDYQWAHIHAQQAAGMAANLEECVRLRAIEMGRQQGVPYA